MKKILAVLLVLAMAMTLALPAFADEPTTGGSSTGQAAGDSTINISGKYDNTQQSQEAPVVSTDIVWDSSMTFTYTKPNPGTWNDKTHEYDGKTDGGWDDTQKMPITITNHSDVYISVKLAFTKTCNEDIYECFWTKDSAGNYTQIYDTEGFVLESAVGKSKTEADSEAVYLSIHGDPIATEGKIGTITVTIANVTKKVSNVEEFKAMVDGDGSNVTGGYVILMDDIDLGEGYIQIYKDVIIDLNGHKLTSSHEYYTIFNPNSNTVIKNGTVENTSTGGYAVSTNYNASIAITDCTLKAKKTVLDANLDASDDDVVIKLHNVKIETDATDLWFVLQIADNYSGKIMLKLSGNYEGQEGLLLPHAMTNTGSNVSGIYTRNYDGSRIDMTDHSAFLVITAGEGYYKYFDPTGYYDDNNYDLSNDGDEWFVISKY